MPELNVPLLRKVMEHIDTHPEEWEQSAWATHFSVEADKLKEYRGRGMLRWPMTHFREHVEYDGTEYVCKTAYCFAGHAAVMSGATFKKINDITWNGEVVILPDGTQRRVRSYAVELLGLTQAQAFFLFNGGNSRAALRRMVNNLIEKGQIE